MNETRDSMIEMLFQSSSHKCRSFQTVQFFCELKNLEIFNLNELETFNVYGFYETNLYNYCESSENVLPFTAMRIKTHNISNKTLEINFNFRKCIIMSLNIISLTCNFSHDHGNHMCMSFLMIRP